MNLYYDSSTMALRQLISGAEAGRRVHSIAVDYDGEVIIDPEVHFPDVDISKYKFCFMVRKTSLQNLRKIQLLHAALMSTFKEQQHTMVNQDYNVAA